MEDDIQTRTEKISDKTEFIAVDFFRLVFAIGIVALHLGPLRDISKLGSYFLTHVLTRLSVPFFFLVSGFFLQKKIHDGQKIKRYVVRLLQLYLIYTVLYLPQIIAGYIKSGGSWIHNLWMFVRDFLIVGPYWQLWYFMGIIVAVVLLYLLKHTFQLKNRHIAVIVLVLYVIGTIGDAYIQPLQERINGLPVSELVHLDKNYLLLWLYFTVFGTTRNGIFFGLPYVFFGCWIAESKDKIPCKNYLLPATPFFLVMSGEAFMVHEIFGATDNNMLFALLPTAIFVFLWILSIDCKKTDRNLQLAKHLRCVSVLYFGLHKWIEFYFVSFPAKVLGVELHSLVRFALVVFLNLVAAEIILRLADLKGFQWLKNLY